MKMTENELSMHIIMKKTGETQPRHSAFIRKRPILVTFQQLKTSKKERREGVKKTDQMNNRLITAIEKTFAHIKRVERNSSY